MSVEMWAAVLGIGVILPLVFIYNRLVAERNLVREGYALIDVQLKHRADLVPQLVEAVRGYAASEKALFTVTEAWSAALAAQPPAERFSAERSLGSGLTQLVLLRESHPQLKADASFLELSRQLAEVEDQLHFALHFYNGAVQRYRTRIESFPDALVAKLFRFRPMPLFETDDRRGPGLRL